MKVFSILRVLALAALLMAFSSQRAGAQNLGFAVSGSPNPVLVNSNLTYTIGLTNLNPLTMPNVFVTNSLPSSIRLLSAAISFGAFTTNATNVTFNLGPMAAGQGAQMTVIVAPTALGFITNTIDVFSALPLAVTTNVVNQVTNTQPVLTDLAVFITGLPPNALLNDWIDYTVTVSNFGPAAATSVVLSNTFSSAVRLINASPANQSSSSNTFIFNLGTLASGAGTKIKLTVEPTNSVPLTNIVFVGAGTTDPNPANNTASSSLTVIDRIAGVLIATNLSAMTFNPQDSVMEQTIRLVNLSSSNAASARVIVAGLTTNRLYNAVGSNSLGTLKGNPFVSYTASLGPNESVDLLMEYVVTNRLPFTVSDTNLFAYALPPFSPTTTIDTNAPFNITSVVLTPLGHVLIEFQSTPGRSYTIFYSTNSSDFSNALAAQPDVTAQADRTQWIDDGPPKTVSKPLDATSRFYRARLNP